MGHITRVGGSNDFAIGMGTAVPTAVEDPGTAFVRVGGYAITYEASDKFDLEVERFLLDIHSALLAVEEAKTVDEAAENLHDRVFYNEFLGLFASVTAFGVDWLDLVVEPDAEIYGDLLEDLCTCARRFTTDELRESIRGWKDGVPALDHGDLANLLKWLSDPAERF